MYKPQPQATLQKFGEVWLCGFQGMQADRQTDILITIIRIPLKGEVTMNAKSHAHKVVVPPLVFLQTMWPKS